MSIIIAAQDATFDPEIFLVTSSYFLLRKSAQNPFIHTVNTKKNTQRFQNVNDLNKFYFGATLFVFS